MSRDTFFFFFFSVICCEWQKKKKKFTNCPLSVYLFAPLLSSMQFDFSTSSSIWSPAASAEDSASAYPTPAHSEYSGDGAISNRSSLGNVFDASSLSIWSQGKADMLPLTKSLSSLSSSSVSSLAGPSGPAYGLFPASPTLASAQLRFQDDMSPFKLQTQPQAVSATAVLGEMISPNSTQINLHRGIQDDAHGQFRAQLMMSINKRQQQQQQQQVQQVQQQQAQQQQPQQQQIHMHPHPHEQQQEQQPLLAPASGVAAEHHINRSLFKTELCAKFQQTGSCPYNSKCQFAHGLEELKSSSKPKNWKTKMCRSWERSGYCSYGKRCCYKHGETDDGSTIHFQQPPPQVLKY